MSQRWARGGPIKSRSPHRVIRNVAGSVDVPWRGIYAQSVSFGGTQAYNRGADFTGNADGKVGTVSFWINFQGGDGALQVVYAVGAVSEIQRRSTNTMRFDFYTSAVAQVFRVATNTSITASSGWCHFLCAWDAVAGVTQLYLNDVSDITVESAIVNSTIDYTQSDHFIGQRSGGTNRVNAYLAEFWFDNANYMDISVTENRRKFITSDRKPEFLGLSGERPTGSAPRMFFSGDSTSFVTNRGTGGGMTTIGSPGNGTSPS